MAFALWAPGAKLPLVNEECLWLPDGCVGWLLFGNGECMKQRDAEIGVGRGVRAFQLNKSIAFGFCRCQPVFFLRQEGRELLASRATPQSSLCAELIVNEIKQVPGQL